MNEKRLDPQKEKWWQFKLKATHLLEQLDDLVKENMLPEEQSEIILQLMHKVQHAVNGVEKEDMKK